MCGRQERWADLITPLKVRMSLLLTFLSPLLHLTQWLRYVWSFSKIFFKFKYNSDAEKCTRCKSSVINVQKMNIPTSDGRDCYQPCRSLCYTLLPPRKRTFLNPTHFCCSCFGTLNTWNLRIVCIFCVCLVSFLQHAIICEIHQCLYSDTLWTAVRNSLLFECTTRDSSTHLLMDT